MAKIEIILLESYTKLGTVGDVVKVNAGYARNFLLPQHKALRSTPANRKVFESRREQLILASENREDKATLLGTSLAEVKVKISRQAGVSGHLYGSVSARDISEALTKIGHPISHNMVQLPRPIKSVGSYNVILELSPKILHNLQVDVINSSYEDGDIPLHIGMRVFDDKKENSEEDDATDKNSEKDSSDSEKIETKDDESQSTKPSKPEITDKDEVSVAEEKNSSETAKKHK